MNTVMPYDQYQRYRNVADIITLVRTKENKVFTILEVGANAHKNLERLLPDDQITYLDVEVPEDLLNDPAYVVGDATQMTFNDRSFDFVVALDVFEHIPTSRREHFLSEVARVSRVGYLIAGPFDTTGVAEAERRANAFYKTLYGENYRWLEEHVENTLPSLEESISSLSRLGSPLIHFAHGSVAIWERMLKTHFLGAGEFVLHDYRFEIDDYYNKKIYPVDYVEPSYRQFLVGFRKDELKILVEQWLSQRRIQSASSNDRANYLDRLEEYFRILSLKTNTTQSNKQIQHLHERMEQALAEQAEITRIGLQNVKESLQAYLKQIEDKDQIIAEKNDIIAGQKYELDKHIAELRMKDAVITEKDLLLVEKDALLVEKDEFLHQKEVLISELRMAIEQKELELLRLQENLQEAEIRLQERVRNLEEQAASKEQHIVKLEILSQELRLKNRLKNLLPRKFRRLAKKAIKIGSIAVSNPSYIVRGINELRNNGLSGLRDKVNGKYYSAETTPSDYHIVETTVDIEVLKEQVKAMQYKPLLSVVVPVYNVDPLWLDLAIKSVTNQVYDNWELCLVDDCSTNKATVDYLKTLHDPRIKVGFLSNNLGISGATNHGVSLSTGEYIALLDNDDEYTLDALYEIAKAVIEHHPDVIYSDEDKVDVKGVRKFPFHKPDWSPDLLRSQMYIGHIFCFRRDLFDRVGGFRVGFEGSQDYDLALRMSEVGTKIHHIPKVLYSWRELETSTALNPYAKPDAHVIGLRALNEHLERVFGTGKARAVEDHSLFVYDARYTFGPELKVSIIIPTKDKVELLDPCVRSILEKSSHRNFEIVILSNNSELAETEEWFKKIQATEEKVKVIEANYEFNWSKLNNHGIREATGDVYIFLNNDTVVITEDWIERLSEQALREDVGTVGPLLLYEDDTIQHAGVIVGMGGWADHVFKGMEPIHFGSPFISPMVTRNVLASTGACLAISRKRIEQIGGFNEEFIICGSDVELSIRAYKLGYYNIYDPHVKLYHYESKTRSSYVPEIDFQLSAVHYSPYREEGDPFYNRNLSTASCVPTTR